LVGGFDDGSGSSLIKRNSHDGNAKTQCFGLCIVYRCGSQFIFSVESGLVTGFIFRIAGVFTGTHADADDCAEVQSSPAAHDCGRIIVRDINHQFAAGNLGLSCVFAQ
jgi:hypothetical protein